VHPTGVRAERAAIEALATYSRWITRQKHAVWSIAERLGVDVVDLGQLGQVAERYGAKLPETLLPAQSPHRRGVGIAA
jgi:hypothetical protein